MNYKGKVDLVKIYLNFFLFVWSEMQGFINGSRYELKQIISYFYCEEVFNLQNLFDFVLYMREIVEEIWGDIGIDKCLEFGDDIFLMVILLKFFFMCLVEENYFDYDCEFIF